MQQIPIRTNTDSMHRKLLWLPVEKRLALSTVTFFSNSIYSTKPEFLHRQIIKCSNFHSHFTRTAGDGQIMLPCPKSNALKKTVIYRAINHWNNCPLYIRQSNNKSSFKYDLRMHFLSSWSIVQCRLCVMSCSCSLVIAPETHSSLHNLPLTG